MAASEQMIGTFFVGSGPAATEFEVIVRARQASESADKAAMGEPCIGINLTLDDQTRAAAREICRRGKVPRYLGLELALKAIAEQGQERPFIDFVTSTYVDPRRISGQQNHFKLSPEANELFTKLSWECAAGNKSRLARAAVTWFARMA